MVLKTYDRDKEYISQEMPTHFINTETELAQDLKPGDTVVYIKNATNWKKSSDSSGIRFLGIYPYKDYPMFTYTRYCYQFNDSSSINNTITLTSPYVGSIVYAGSKIANNYNGPGTYTYNTMGGNVIPNAWTKYSSNITGSPINVDTHNQFRYATKYIKIMILINWYNNLSDTVLVDDLEFKDTTNTIFNSKIQELCISNIARSDSDILNRFRTGILVKDSNVTYMLTD